jgi:hypothetical protein
MSKEFRENMNKNITNLLKFPEEMETLLKEKKTHVFNANFEVCNIYYNHSEDIEEILKYKEEIKKIETDISNLNFKIFKDEQTKKINDSKTKCDNYFIRLRRLEKQAETDNSVSIQEQIERTKRMNEVEHAIYIALRSELDIIQKKDMSLKKKLNDVHIHFSEYTEIIAEIEAKEKVLSDAEDDLNTILKVYEISRGEKQGGDETEEESLDIIEPGIIVYDTPTKKEYIQCIIS